MSDLRSDRLWNFHYFTFPIDVSYVLLCWFFITFIAKSDNIAVFVNIGRIKVASFNLIAKRYINSFGSQIILYKKLYYKCDNIILYGPDSVGDIIITDLIAGRNHPTRNLFNAIQLSQRWNALSSCSSPFFAIRCCWYFSHRHSKHQSVLATSHSNFESLSCTWNTVLCYSNYKTCSYRFQLWVHIIGKFESI